MVSGLSLAAPSDIGNRFGVSVPASFERADRIDPGSEVVVLEAGAPGSASVGRWGFALEDTAPARAAVPAEALEDRSVLTRAFDRNRVLVLADGVELDGQWFERTDGSVFAVAGIRHPTAIDGGVAIVTVAGADFDPPHVPVVVPPAQVEIWLHYSHASELSAFLTPPDPTTFRVGPRRTRAG